MHTQKRLTSDSTLVIITVLWTLGVFAYLWFNQEMESALWFLNSFVWCAVWLVGLIFCGIALWRIVEQKPSMQRVIPLGLIAPQLFMIVYWGTNWVYPIRVQKFDLPYRYEPELKRLLAMTPAQRKNLDRRKFNFDEGRPLRIAFVEPGGMLDNWSAIVYDPTGLVMKSNEVTMETLHDPKHAAYVKLFGGDLFGAESLGGYWYRCFFT